MQAADELARVLGWQTEDCTTLPWEIVEDRLGCPVPTDFKRLMTAFPSGIVDSYIEFVNPVEGASEFSRFFAGLGETLEYLMPWYRKGAVPYAVYPEQAGLIPWGQGGDGQTFFWLPIASSADEWRIVFCDDSFSVWEEYQGTVSAFLLDFVSGRIDSPLLSDYEAIDQPDFYARRQDRELSQVGPAPVKQAHYWNSLRASVNPASLVDTSRDLAGLLERTWQSKQGDWARVEADLGVRLPTDYRSVVDTFGPGDFLGIKLAVPAARTPEFDLRRLVEAAPEIVRTGGPAIEPYFPEPGGLVPWGFTDAGHVFFWAPISDDPNKWPVVMGTAGHRAIFHRTMSGVLLAHVTRTGGDVGMLPDPASFGSPDRPLFVPA